MKGKLAVLGFLCAAITVGGVYATWTFSEGAAPKAEVDVKVSLAGESTGTQKGTLTVIVNDTTNPLKLLIDDTNNDHNAELLKTGNVIVTFTPSDTATDDVKNNGIAVDLKITCNVDGVAKDFTAWTYGEGENAKQIFDVETQLVHIDPIGTESENIKWTYDTEKNQFVYVFDVTNAQSPFGIKLHDENGNGQEDDIRLDTLADYTAFKAALDKGNFVFTVSEHEDSQN